MTLTDSNLRYLLAIHHLAQQSTEVSPLALAQAMGVTKPSVTSILTSLMKQGSLCGGGTAKFTSRTAACSTRAITTSWSRRFCSTSR